MHGTTKGAKKNFCGGVGCQQKTRIKSKNRGKQRGSCKSRGGIGDKRLGARDKGKNSSKRPVKEPLAAGHQSTKTAVTRRRHTANTQVVVKLLQHDFGPGPNPVDSLTKSGVQDFKKTVSSVKNNRASMGGKSIECRGKTQ